MKNFYSFLLILLIACGLWCLPQHVNAQESEPNNTPAMANTLALNGSSSGVINPAADVDWWKVKTTSDGLLSVTLTPLSGANTYVVLYDTAGTVQLTGSYSTTAFTITQDGLAAGTYYLKVFCYYSTDTSSYTISNALTTAPVPNDMEPDSTRATALTLAVNDSTRGHIGYYYNNHRDTIDEYKITTNADGLLRLSLNPINGTNVFITLYDNDGTTVLTSQYAASPFSMSTDGLAAGIYYVKVYCYYNGQFTPYVLSDSLFPVPVPNDAEPDSTRGTALTLALNDSARGHICYYYNNHRDTVDEYKLTTNADGDIYLSLSIPNNTAVNYVLYDNDGVTVLQSSYTYNNGNYSVDGLAAGTYYIKVYCYYNNQFAPYTLKDSLATYNKNDAEPNGYALQAPTILTNRTTTGHVGFYYNQVRDTTDWAKVNYTGTDGNLTFTFDLLQPLSSSYNNTYFQVYSDTGAAPIYSSYVTAPSTVVNLTGLAQGYYYVKVFEYYTNQFEAYSIADSFTQVNKATISLAKAASSDTTCGSDSLTFNLGASHAPYTVRLYKDGMLTDSMTTNSATASFTALNDGNYYATIYGDGATDSAYNKTGSTQFLPTTPSGLSASGIGPHTATLNITMLSCVQHYIVQYKVTGTSTYTTINTPVNTNGTFMLTGLNPSTMYTYRIASVDSSNALVSAYSDTAVFTTLTDLPVTFLNFDGVLDNGRALLSWSTATELNNKGFGVEKSYDGQNFTGIGFVAGHGNSSVVNNYNYIDVKVLSGYNYYRLKQTDIDGNFNYSSTIRLDFKNFDWSILGNPVSANSWIQLQLPKTSHIALQIITSDGRILQTINKGNLSAGTYSIPLSLGNVASEVYIIKLITDDQSYSKKVVR